MRLVIFDVDKTLLSGNTDNLWVQFLARAKGYDAERHEKESTALWLDYKKGNIPYDQWLAHQWQALSMWSEGELSELRDQFFKESITPRIRARALEAVKGHQEAGDLVILASATHQSLIEPWGAVLDLTLGQMVTSESEVEPDGRLSNRLKGIASLGKGKELKVRQWLERRGESWDSFSEVWFYSDSIHDLPLLERASHPIVVTPDEELLAVGTARQWPIRYWT